MRVQRAGIQGRRLDYDRRHDRPRDQEASGILLPPDPEDLAKLEKFMSWAEPFRKIGVRANADIPRDASRHVQFGAEGIGLCRTEHMFFGAGSHPRICGR